MTYDVSVSSLVPAKFPDRCVLCGAAGPERQVRFSAGAKYGAFFFLSWFGKGKSSLQAPACGSCAVSALCRSLIRFALSAAAATVAAWFLFAGMKGGRGIFKLKAIAVFFAAVIPPFIWDKLFPARFSVAFDHEHNQAVCHFFDAAYAAEFDALNHPPVPGELELPEGLQLGEVPAPQPLELPADFNPSTSARPSSTSGQFSVTEAYEDKTNPFRNLEDPRFRK